MLRRRGKRCDERLQVHMIILSTARLQMGPALKVFLCVRWRGDGGEMGWG